jgi:hypothetical protein
MRSTSRKNYGKMDLFRIIHDGAPDQGIPTVVWTLDDSPEAWLQPV